jgi:hypothetical protein
MSRHHPVGNRGREARKARTFALVYDSLEIALRIYKSMGGEDIDFGIESARLTLQLYKNQLEGRAADGIEPVSHDQAGRARAQLANLSRQRERKLSELRKLVEEGLHTDDERATDEPEDGDADETSALPAAHETPARRDAPVLSPVSLPAAHVIPHQSG